MSGPSENETLHTHTSYTPSTAALQPFKDNSFTTVRIPIAAAMRDQFSGSANLKTRVLPIVRVSSF